MRADEQSLPEEAKSKQRFRWELFYYQKVGSNYYFRITPFAIILLLVSALVGIAIIVFDLRANPPQPTNINVTVPSASPESSDNRGITPVPPRTLQRTPAQSDSSKQSSTSTSPNVNTSKNK